MVRPEHHDREDPRDPIGRQQVIEILQAYREQLRQLGVRKISLFGSAARGYLRPDSDVDMIVEFSPTSYKRLLELKSFLETILRRKVDPLTPAAVQGRLKEEIEKDLVDVLT